MVVIRKVFRYYLKDHGDGDVLDVLIGSDKYLFMKRSI